MSSSNSSKIFKFNVGDIVRTNTLYTHHFPNKPVLTKGVIQNRIKTVNNDIRYDVMTYQVYRHYITYSEAHLELVNGKTNELTKPYNEIGYTRQIFRNYNKQGRK